MNIVVHDSALGDWVLTWPVLRTLAAADATWAVTAWPKARLAAELIPNVVAIDGGQARWSRLFAPEASPSLGTDHRAALESAACIVSFVSRGDDAWAANVREVAPRARLAFVPPRPPADWLGHVTDWHRQCLVEQGIDVSPSSVPPSGDATGTIIVHPGSGGEAKRWPTERFEDLILRLRSNGHDVTPVLGEVEWQRWGDVALRHWRASLGAVVTPSLGALKRMLFGARLYVGNDSGPSHLAAQLGTPTIALFGVTDPARWAPLGPAVTVVAPSDPQPMDWLPVVDLVDIVDRTLT